MPPSVQTMPTVQKLSRRFAPLAWLLLAMAASAPAQVGAFQELQATALHGRRIDLRWADASFEEGYRIARSCEQGDAQGYCTIASLGPDVVYFKDFGVQESSRYEYRVEAFSKSISETAFTSTETPSPTALPTVNPPIYPDPQGAWSLGSPIPLNGITQLRVRHNLGSSRELRILLNLKDPHSLLSRLEDGGYKINLKRRYAGVQAAGVAEIYFYDLTKGGAEGALPPAIDSFERMNEEGYVLIAESMGENSIRIVVGAQTPKGLFRGGFMVERLLLDADLERRRTTLEPVVILDYPDHASRGARPSWAPMNQNYQSVPEATLDMLDALARSGATEVDWSFSAPAQESYSWKKGGARTAAAVQIAAAERFMEVNYFAGGAIVGNGMKGSPETQKATHSFDQVPFGDGLGVLAESFAWIETSPGQWQALSTRQGKPHGRGMDERGRPWLAKPCALGGWKYAPLEEESGETHMLWRLDGMARECSLVQSLAVKDAFAPGRYFLGTRIKASNNTTDLSGSLELEIESSNGTTRFPLTIPSELSSERWTELGIAFETSHEKAGVRAARIIVRASLASGTLLIDEVSLNEWSNPPLSYESFSESRGWSFSSGGFASDHSVGRLDSTSLKVVTPLDLRAGNAAHIAERYTPLRLQEGRHILGAWIKAEGKELEPLASTADRDGDGLADLAETDTGIFREANDTGSNPVKSDTDGDGFSDGAEVAAGSNPNLKSSQPGSKFSMKMDINLYLFDQSHARKANTSKHIDRQFLNLPSHFKLNREGWMYHAHIFDVSSELAAKARSGRVQVRIFQTQDAGTIRLDDLHLRRLDGDLRNLMGAVKAPILRSPSGITYVEGKDYQVCQVGRDRTQCEVPSNYTTLLEGGLAATYHPDLTPFEIRWLGKTPPQEKSLLISYDIGAQYSSAGSTELTWDDQLTVSKALNLCDMKALLGGIGLEKILGRYLDGYPIENFPRHGQTYTFRADSLTWGISEVRGVGRSLACIDESSGKRLSHAAIFAEAVNEVVRISKTKRKDVRFWLWDDMFNPFNNGGDPNYQVRFGGKPGRSACSFAPAAIKSLCGDEVENVPMPIIENEELWQGGIVMKPWSYSPHGLRRMVATASWYQDLGVKSQVLSGASPVNVEDWASIANSFDEILGGMGTIYHANKYGGRSGLFLSLQKFWNHDWKLLYLHDNETAESSHYQPAWPFKPEAEFKDANHDTTGRCAAFNFKFSGNHEGGICLDGAPASPKIGLGPIPTRGRAHYRMDVLAKRSRKSRSSSATEPPTFRIFWSTGESSGPLVAELIYDTTAISRPDYFDRYRVETEAPPHATSMQMEISFGRGGESAAADDIAIFESTEQCFDACQP